LVTPKNYIRTVDKEMADLLSKEEFRQEMTIELIASENYVSKAVLEAMGSVATNKYAEGKPGQRHYGGCETIDKIENLAVERAKKLFGCEHANVQPHAGSQANRAVYDAVLKPGDTILGMELSCGGHLTHGSKANFSGKFYKAASYGVNEKGLIDYDEVLDIALDRRPKMIICGASAYPREIDFEKFRKIADKADAYLLADIAHIAGLVATGLHQSPIGKAHFVTTTTHKTLRGPRGAIILCNKEKEKNGNRTLDKMIDSAVFPGGQGGPLENMIAAKAVAFMEAMQPEFKEYQRQVIRNANVLAEELGRRGFNLVSGGTDTHLMLVDLREIKSWRRSYSLTGYVLEKALEEANIILNKNQIPYDKRKQNITSGVRIGTPAVTTRGMKEEEMKTIAGMINKVSDNICNYGEKDYKLPWSVREDVKTEVMELCSRFRVYLR